MKKLLKFGIKVIKYFYYSMILNTGYETLYIIGNGFDLYHGRNSSYKDFKKFLAIKNPEVLEKLEDYLGGKSLWSDFEEALARLDTEKIVEECENYLQSYSVEDWKDSYNHDYQYEINKRIDLITEEMRKLFTEWVLQIQLTEEAYTKKIYLYNNSVFLSFNYTNTLEKLYKVQAKNILYIHNKATNNKSTLILGHSRNPISIKSLNPR